MEIGINFLERNKRLVKFSFIRIKKVYKQFIKIEQKGRILRVEFKLIWGESFVYGNRVQFFGNGRILYREYRIVIIFIE